MKRILFCAGEIGRNAAMHYRMEGIGVDYFIDNSDKLQKKGSVLDIPVISINDLIKIQDEYSLEVACGDDIYDEIVDQLQRAGIDKFERFDRKELYRKERITSYSYKSNCEDIILWHVLKNEDDIFYIDVGCNDPVSASVTKFIYDMGGHGINIDMVPDMIDFMNIDRRRDINICTALGNKMGG